MILIRFFKKFFEFRYKRKEKRNEKVQGNRTIIGKSFTKGPYGPENTFNKPPTITPPRPKLRDSK